MIESFDSRCLNLRLGLLSESNRSLVGILHVHTHDGNSMTVKHSKRIFDTI